MLFRSPNAIENKQVKSVVMKPTDGALVFESFKREKGIVFLQKETKKVEIIKRILELMKGNYTEFAFKHDGCRTLQGCLKYGSKEQRKTIISILKDSVYDLCIKKYSIYLALKLWKFAEKEEQESLVKCIVSKLSHIIKVSSGQTFINFVFANASPSIQQMIIDSYMHKILKVSLKSVKSFYSANEKDVVLEPVEETDNKMEVDEEDSEANSNEEVIEEYNILMSRREGYLTEKFKEEIKKTLETALEKKTHTNSVFHAALSQIFDFLDVDVKTYLSELFDDDFDVFLSTKPGIELACRLFIVSSAKTKKKIIKIVFKDD